MNIKRILSAGILAVPFMFLATSAQADPVTGQANIAGTVSVNQNSVVFDTHFTNATNSATETGSFAGLTGGEIMSLYGGPKTGNVSVANFMTFDQGVHPAVYFDLTYIAPGVGSSSACNSNAVGSMCTPNGSPFTLIQLTSNTVLASLQLNGQAYTAPKSGGYSDAVSIFSTQFVVNGTIPQILNEIATTGINGQSFSASITATAPTATPEPASMALLGIGLVGAGAIARRKKTA